MLLSVQRFTATAIDDVHVSFTCSACNATAEADVMTASSADTEMPIHVSASLRDATRDEALAGLSEVARQMVGLAGCPHCNAMDPGIARNAKILAGLAALATWYGAGATVIAIVLGVIGSAAESIVTRFIAFALAAGLLALAFGLGGRSHFAAKRRAATARVTWQEHGATG